MLEQKKVITIINPNLVIQKGDNLGSGIPYLPLTLAYLAACLKNDYEINLIDAFGEDPFKIYTIGMFHVQGLTTKEVEERINPSAECIILYYSTIMANIIINAAIKNIKAKYPDIPIIIIENSQAVIGCSLEAIKESLFKAGADYLVFGENEERVPLLIKAIEQSSFEKIKNIGGCRASVPAHLQYNQ